MPRFDPEQALRALERESVRYVVIGAIAARSRGAPIVTDDLDVTPASDRDNLERLVEALHALDARLRVPHEPDGITFPLDADILASSQSWTLATIAGDLDLVFMPAGSRGYTDLVREASMLELASGLVVPVASLLDVIRCTEASNRPKDRQSLPILRLTLEEIRRQEAEARRQA